MAASHSHPIANRAEFSTETVPAKSGSAIDSGPVTNSGPETQSGPIGTPVQSGDEDIYVLLQGPAHIVPVAEKKIKVYFLDGTLTRKEPIVFDLETDPETGLTGLKIRNLQLIIECNEVTYKRREREGILSQHFPDTFDVIDKTPQNMAHMNPPPPPPFNKG